MSKTAKIIFGVVLVVIVALALYFLINSLVGPREINFSELVSFVEKYIAEHGGAEGMAIITSGLTFTVYINNAATYFAHAPNVDYTPYVEELNKLISDNNISQDGVDPNAGSYWSYLIPVIGIILVCVVFWLLIRQTQGGSSKAMSFAKSKARVNQNIKVR